MLRGLLRVDDGCRSEDDVVRGVTAGLGLTGVAADAGIGW